MRPNDWEWRREQEEACRLFDFVDRRVDEPRALHAYLLEQKINKFKEESIMVNLARDVRDELAKNNARRNIMNKLKVGDKICTSSNLTTPLEIAAFDYKHWRILVKSHLSGEGYERFSRFWIDPLTITDPDVRIKVSYADYYAMKREQKKADRIPTPKKIIVNEDSKVTVVMWDDGTKTIVKCSDADQYDSYAAYCAAFAKKCYGTNSQLKKTIENLTVVQESKKKKAFKVTEYEFIKED